VTVESTEREENNLSSGYQSNLNGITPSASGSVVRFFTYPPFVTPPAARGPRRDGASKRRGTARLLHCSLVGTHPELSTQEDVTGGRDVRQAVCGKAGQKSICPPPARLLPTGALPTNIRTPDRSRPSPGAIAIHTFS